MDGSPCRPCACCWQPAGPSTRRGRTRAVGRRLCILRAREATRQWFLFDRSLLTGRFFDRRWRAAARPGAYRPGKVTGALTRERSWRAQAGGGDAIDMWRRRPAPRAMARHEAERRGRASGTPLRCRRLRRPMVVMGVRVGPIQRASLPKSNPQINRPVVLGVNY
jgi:hypothetical protein